MSFGKLVRRIVKKWLKRETEPATPESLIDYDCYEDRNLDRLSPEPCMFCVEPDGACSGDLNRNVHISDATGFTGSGDGRRWKCVEYGGFADSSESTERSCDSVCRSSRAPAPVCVCEACYIFRSPNLPSAISTSSRITAPDTAAAAAGQAIADDVTKEEFCPYRRDVDVDSRFASGKFLKSGVTSSELEDCGGGCRKSSVSLTSTARQIHSASGEKQHLAGNTEQPQQQRLPETICPTADLPVSVVLSLDGEEGYARSQRRLRGRNQRHCYDAAKTRFHPPPNKTICHVTECRNNSNVVS